MKTPFRISATDRDNPLWRALSAHIAERRDELRAKNDASQSIEDTEKLRGRIDELNTLLALAEDRSHRQI